MSINKINEHYPTTDKIELLNDQTVELDGRTKQAEFDKTELDAVYSGTGLHRKWKRNLSLSGSSGASAWYNWNHIKSQTGYSIWRFDSTLGITYNSKNEMYFDNNSMNNKGDATSEDITAFDKVFTYDGSSYTDVTTEATTEGGTAFNLLVDTGDYIYIGHSATFSGIDFGLDTRAANYTLDIEYSDAGGSWSALNVNEYDVTDGTSSMRRSGALTIGTKPNNWSTATVNSIANKYWIRISTSTAPVTTGKANYILPFNSVPSLLALSSADIANEDWAFCHYNIPGTGARLYVTLRNTGDDDYEGNWYIASSSTTTQKQNFFRFNHTIKGNFQDLDYQYSGAGLYLSRADGVAPLVLLEGTGGPLISFTGVEYDTKAAQDKYIKILWNGGTAYLRIHE